MSTKQKPPPRVWVVDTTKCTALRQPSLRLYDHEPVGSRRWRCGCRLLGVYVLEAPEPKKRARKAKR
jgi:hypothetical protein